MPEGMVEHFKFSYSVICLVAIVVIACGPSDDSRVIKGEVILVQADASMSPDDCSGTGRYEGINAATEVIVSDGNGAEVGVATLGRGEATDSGCQFRFSVSGLPEAADYTIEIRDYVKDSYSLGEIRDSNWTVSFEVGN